jgi:hypothetical protein
MVVLSAPLVAAHASAQAASADSIVAVDSARENVWVSGGVGVGSMKSTTGVAGAAGLFLSYRHFVVGAHGSTVAEMFGPFASEQSFLVGLRDLQEHELLMIALGPARLAGNQPNPFGKSLAKRETGIAAVAQATINLPIVGIGVEGFIAGGPHRTLRGVTLSLQLGWLGR